MWSPEPEIPKVEGKRFTAYEDALAWLDEKIKSRPHLKWNIISHHEHIFVTVVYIK